MPVVDTDLADINDGFCYITIRRIREIVDMSNDAVDQVRTVSHALEERVEICGAAIRFHVQLGQIPLKVKKARSILSQRQPEMN